MRKRLPIPLLFFTLFSLAAARPTVNTHYYKIQHVMKCRVHLPEDYNPAKVYPLLIALHGNGGSAQDFDPLWEKYTKAQCLIATPEGPYVLPPQKRRDIPGYSWFLLVNDRRIWALADPLGVQAMMDTVNEIRTSYKVGPVYLLGFSQGASLAYQATIQHPDVFRGVIALAGIYPVESIRSEDLKKAMPTLRVFIAHGTDDHALPMTESEKARNLLKKEGFNVHFQTFKEGHTLPSELFQDMLTWMEIAGCSSKKP